MPETLSVQCSIAGGGPAGMMLGLLLARAGVSVLVLEKHADFLRDFRGDTLHPSTLEIMHELEMLERFLQLPHQKVSRINARFGDLEFTVADFSHLPTQCRYVAFMPQWDFLNFLLEVKQGKWKRSMGMAQTSPTGDSSKAWPPHSLSINTIKLPRRQQAPHFFAERCHACQNWDKSVSWYVRIREPTMTTIDVLKIKRNDILRLASQHGAHHVRVFGSVARGEAGPASDIDIPGADGQRTQPLGFD